MKINNLHLENFRNYDIEDFVFDESCNVIFGENAQGKTNLLESIIYLSCGKSPRAHTDKEIVGFDKESALIEGNVFSRERDFRLRVEMNPGKQKKILINGVKAKNNAALSDVIHTIYFAPEDLFLIRDGAAARRKFMDISLCQLRPRYAEALTEFNKLYEHKTRILRDSEEIPQLLATLPDFNERLCQVGAVLIHYRAQYCEALKEHAASAHKECSGGKEILSLSYQTVKTVQNSLASTTEIYQWLKEHQENHYSAEIASKLCLSGPHKDDIEIMVNGKSARQYCSQGQVRTAALSMKLADREIHKNVFGEYPIMMLDDVLSELDSKRQEFVLNRISGGQIFITCCESDRLNTMIGGKIFHIKNGEAI